MLRGAQATRTGLPCREQCKFAAAAAATPEGEISQKLPPAVCVSLARIVVNLRACDS